MVLYRNDKCNAEPAMSDNGLIPRRGGGVAIYIKDKWAPFVSKFDRGTIITENFEILSLKIDKPNFKKM